VNSNWLGKKETKFGLKLSPRKEVIRNQGQMVTEAIHSLLVCRISTNFSTSSIYLALRKANFAIKTPSIFILLPHLPKYSVGLINTRYLVLLTMNF
jgi:hypothetical protein